MPIPLPNLDDRTYADLVEEMRALIPRYAPEWTDHNESDPGIMLVEMFAWLAEALIYRTNRITANSERRMLALLGVPASQPDGSQLPLDEARAMAVNNVRARWRAITADDFEQLVAGQPEFGLARAKCLPELDLTATDPYTPRPGHVSVIIVPFSEDPKPVPSTEVTTAVWNFLDDRRLVTCRHHVVGPTYTDIRIEAEVVRVSQVKESDLLNRVKEHLTAFFQPLTGGPDKTGWPFGRDIYASEIYQVIEDTPGVDHVESLALLMKTTDEEWIQADNDYIVIPPNNLVCFDDSGEITIRV